MKLGSSLPGKNAQHKMAPNPVNGTNNPKNYKPANDDFRNSSVLVPLVSWKEELEIILTLRTQTINHGGQLSFPGGGKEGDETIIETALREAQEEIGLQSEGVHIVGQLTPLYVGHSDNMVTPVVAFLEQEQVFTPNPNEVDEIISVPISKLVEEQNLVEENWELRGTPYRVPFWNIHRVPLWGATAMMMNELIELYKEFLETN
ncbi:MAG TPA: CoA pyrophosphatase [Gracilimonas sp.]|uniref:NUDIX hydrolase n=1 Tax=Gracilimonas sp. TaxID=1974203 RepID=UPI002DA80B9E|nr:CoA pyrophosphatase [Gracilimonas sp.]